MAHDLARRAKDPAAFDARHPEVGALLARGIVPRGIDGYPEGPLCYEFVPLLGTKRIRRAIVPGTKHMGLVGVPNFGPPVSEGTPADPSGS